MARSPLQPTKAQRVSKSERPPAVMTSSYGPAYADVPYPYEQCIRAQVKVRRLLESLQMDPKLAAEVFASMLPVLLATDRKRIVGITQNSVKEALRKIVE